MAAKQFMLAGYGEISVSKRSTNRSVRLSIKADGTVVVTIPSWSSYQTGVAFAESKLAWIRRQQPAKVLLKDGQAVGKFHHLQLSPTHGLKVPRSLVSKTTVVVRYPVALSPESATVQQVATAACIRALRAQAEQLLPGRLASLAKQHGFQFHDVRIKRLTSRWGSCDQERRIVLNLFLMQLPWDCIDYVLIHELTHTKILRHGPPFWQAMQQLIPALKSVRQQMRGYRPVLY